MMCMAYYFYTVLFVIMRALSGEARIVQIMVVLGSSLVIAALLTYLIEQPALRLIRSIDKGTQKDSDRNK